MSSTRDPQDDGPRPDEKVRRGGDARRWVALLVVGAVAVVLLVWLVLYLTGNAADDVEGMAPAAVLLALPVAGARGGRATDR
jgi:hypothetical protein